ncbi:MAG TPA: cobalamin-binding protein [Acidimicrobiales bacterium]|nr:cobalamin-binding protein [Acidimicrobiales bacterium]
MKIVSLLPSATEIVYALGLGDQLCGVSFECDFPAEARSVPVVSGTALPTDVPLTAEQIDGEVSSRLAAGLSIYTLDTALLHEIDPDLILVQDLCRVCAVPSGAVEEALQVIGGQAEILSLDPKRLDDVIGCIGAVGKATGTPALADEIMDGLRHCLERVRFRTSGLRPSPRVLFLEWPDPLFVGGHWVPDMIAAAGGTPVLSAPGAPSRRLEWEDVEAERVDVTVFSPCGFDLEGALSEAATLLSTVGDSRLLGRIYAVDANAHFSRPGPRVVDGVELLAGLIHGEESDLPRDRAYRIA